MLNLYFAPKTCALAAHIALEGTGAEYQSTRLDFAAGQQRSAEYLAINPMGRVPALVTERGVLTETPAILLYIAQRYPHAKLAPLNDPYELGQMQAVNSYLCSTVHVAHAHKLRGARWADDTAAHESMRRKVAQNMTDCFALIERNMLRGPWVMGEHYSVADAYLFSITSWLPGDGVQIETFPAVAQHHQRMRVLPAVQRVVAAHA